ncbi:MAG: hypothetical protein IPF57_22820 [Gammaproteobacteria bacterium]|nr:hypothetical protein [Gammaproteobacteria bacterium]
MTVCSSTRSCTRRYACRACAPRWSANSRGHLDFLREFHAALGSPQPQLDAQITNSVLLGLEKSALLAQGPVEIRAVMLRHLQQALQPLPVGT